MYYVKLKIDFSAIDNLTQLLKPFVNSTTPTVNNLQNTTTCKNVSGSMFLCTCKEDHRWSDEVCESHPDCCDKQNCTFSKQSDTCVSKNTVSVRGSIILKEANYSDCLAINTSESYQSCNDGLLTKMKTVYSTIKGFDSLTITKYRVGSVIADFEITYALKVEPQDLIEKSQNMSSTLESSCALETTGVVQLDMPHEPVPYNGEQNLRCSVQQTLDAAVTWQLKRNNRVFDILTGTESIVTTESLGSSISLRRTSELWAGEYTCVYSQETESCTLSHKASSVLDVCLKPNIYISTDPSFPHCRPGSELLNIRVRCEIGKSSEKYSVTWSSCSDTAIKPGSTKEADVYIAETVVRCSPIVPQLTCTFKNRCNQSTNASIDIQLIRENDKFCEAEGDWQKTKAGSTAKLRCKNKAGQRRRKCNNGTSEASWEPEVSECVNSDLNAVLFQANIVDIGLDSIHKNAAEVFSFLENATNNAETIDTFPNLNTSINVLFTLSHKILKQQDDVVDDLVGSSSNLLEKSLHDSWNTKADEGNTSLAERYLSSVEQLIHVTNITQGYEKKNVEVATDNCTNKSSCINKVFNTTVKLKGSNYGIVKTAAFKELQKYLPNNRDDYIPNSFVVSTTTERDLADSVEVEIKFELLQPRPRNVLMICVAWDNQTRGWSTHKCEWKWETDSEGVCVCEHLSSFAILMGKAPLEVRWSTEITYVGLSISVFSLTICLVIEMIVWSAMVKTSTSYFRHTAQVNICLCLLVADCCFLASSKPHDLSLIWCKTLVVLKHFFYLAMFFWMLWLSSTLLHQTVFLFHNMSKKTYLRLSILMGYMCPLIIVTATFLANKAGAEGHYYSKDTCWLVYNAPFQGSIHAFIIPVGTIAFFNMISMVVVILKLLDLPKNAAPACDKDKRAAVTVMRTVVLLTPIFGVTWIFGFAVTFLDLKFGAIAYFTNYVFILLNAFQGLYILLTIYLGDTMTREELLRRLKLKAPASTPDSCTDSSVKK
ncbi:adhesion G-protein coupled receptor F3 isoform X2 [Notolabrus celidotus]|nr:adhesion G-protein coupled receptor F3 isoform X2 [Notolabrus celidotus]